MTAGDPVGRFRAVLDAELGWRFGSDGTARLADVLQRRAKASGLSPTAYLDRLANDTATERAALAEHLTITETYFFRYAEQLHALAVEALPERAAARSGQCRLLSVGCSSGEEAYTLAIVARDAGCSVSVLGVDANPAVLRQATTGRYSAWSLRETPDGVRRRWFRQRDGGYEIDADLRTDVRFRLHHAPDDDEDLWRPGRYDVIFCRNVLMYLTPAAAGALVRHMTRALAPGGYLFLGHTDSLGRNPDDLEPRHGHGTFYYRRITPSAHAVPARRASPTGPPQRRAAPAARIRTDMHERALAMLREERFGAAVAVVEESFPDRPPPRDLLLYGVVLAQAGRLTEAEAAGRRLLDLDALSADGHHLLGVCHEDREAGVAAAQYRIAAHLDLTFAMPRLRLGVLVRRRGDCRAAATELDRALLLLRGETDERITLFGGGFGRAALTTLCRAELDACEVRR
ncbi:MAG TPA: protein-glutamate O-methyltransferase CheR [Actinoplanes sp.]